MDEQKQKMQQMQSVLDADLCTMHIRCGHDIRQTLVDAGFNGFFNLHINPYLEGPVTNAPDWLELRACFIVESFGTTMNLQYEAVLQACHDEEQRLDGARACERVVLWFEHDRYDQFVLMRCLAWFAEKGTPSLVQLVTTNDFPGNKRFLGLGQLPPEALRLLWQQRRTLDNTHLQYAKTVWDAFRHEDPRALVKNDGCFSPARPG